MEPLGYANVLKCVLGLQQCDPGVQHWAPGPLGILVSVLLSILLYVVVKAWKAEWEKRMLPLVQQNLLLLLALSVIVIVELLYPRWLPFLGGVLLLGLAQGARWLAGRDQAPNWLRKISGSVGVAVIVAFGYLGLLAGDYGWQRHQDRKMAARAEQYHVTFLMPADDASGAFVRLANADVSALLAQEVFNDLHSVLVEVFSGLANVRILPQKTENPEQQHLRELFKQPTQLGRILVDVGDANGTPIDTVVFTSFRANYDLVKPRLELFTRLKRLDLQELRLEPLSDQVASFDGYDDELRRLSLLTCHSVLQHLLQTRLKSLSESEQGQIQARLLRLFREYYRDLDTHRDARPVLAEVQDELLDVGPCSDCLSAIVAAYEGSSEFIGPEEAALRSLRTAVAVVNSDRGGE